MPSAASGGSSGPRVRPTPEGTVTLWFAAGFAVVALLLRDNLVFLLGCLFLGVLATSAVLARRNARGLRLARTVPARGRVGVPVVLGYSVTNPRRRSAVGIEVYDRMPPSARPVHVEVDFPGVAGGAEARAETHLTFLRRGSHRFESLELESRYPLGIFRANATADAAERILVRPREGRPTAAMLAWLTGRTPERSRRILPARGQDALYGIREFRDGDDPRRIHWRTTARRGVATVSEWRAEEGREVVVVLGRAPGAGGGAWKGFERAVSVAATIWRTAHVRHLPAVLVTGEPGAVAWQGRRALDRGLDSLAVVRGQGGRRPRAALEALAEKPAARCVVYVAAGPEPGIGRALARAAGPGGDSLFLRADQPGVERWVRGLA